MGSELPGHVVEEQLQMRPVPHGAVAIGAMGFRDRGVRALAAP
ncbi:hypothetical protein [Rhizobium sp. BR 314]